MPSMTEHHPPPHGVRTRRCTIHTFGPVARLQHLRRFGTAVDRGSCRSLSSPDNDVAMVRDNYVRLFIGVTCCVRATAAAASACYGHAWRTRGKHVRAYDNRESIS